MPERKRFVASLTVPNRVESIRLAASFLVQAASSFKVPAVESGLYEVAVVEALNNALKHGEDNPNACIVCEFEIDGRCLKVRVLDEASGAPRGLALPNAVAAWPERTAELHLIAAVFPGLRTVSKNGHHGIEMELKF